MSSNSFDSDAYYSIYKSAVYENLFAGIVFGTYTVLYVVSVHILLSRPGFSSSPRVCMFGITTFMFVSGLIALALDIALKFQDLRIFLDMVLDEGIWFPTVTIYAIWAAITCTMYISSDIICAWRAVVLWNKDKRVIAILVFFILGTTASAALLVFNIVSHPDPFSQVITLEGSMQSDSALPAIMFIPTVGTNLLSTGLIAWKAWQHRVAIKKHLGKGSVSTRVEKVLALLIESGFVYCCLWILYMVSAYDFFPYLGFTVIDSSMFLVAGAYPTLIVVLVCMQKSPVDHFSVQCSTGMQFVANSPNLPSLGSARI